MIFEHWKLNVCFPYEIFAYPFVNPHCSRIFNMYTKVYAEYVEKEAIVLSVSIQRVRVCVFICVL